MSKRQIGRRHPLVATLTAQGLTVREARTVLNAMFNAMKAALSRHESIELPFGRLQVVRHTVACYRRWWHGRPTQFYRHPFRIEFVPLVVKKEAER